MGSSHKIRHRRLEKPKIPSSRNRSPSPSKKDRQHRRTRRDHHRSNSYHRRSRHHRSHRTRSPVSSTKSSSAYDSSDEETTKKNKKAKDGSKDSPIVPNFNTIRRNRMFPMDIDQMSMKEKMQHQAMITTNPVATRIARRVYIGNLPCDMGLNESYLLQFFNVLMRFQGITTPQPVLSVWLSNPPAFCFLDMRSVSDASKCVSLLENFTLRDKKLKVGRPPDYSPPLPTLTNFVVGAVSAGFDCNRVIIDPAAHKIKRDGAIKSNRKINVPFPPTSGTRLSEELIPVKIKPAIDGGTLVTPAFEEDAIEIKKNDPARKPAEQLFPDIPAEIRAEFIAALPKASSLAPSLLDIDVMPAKPCPPSLVVVVENMVIPPELINEREFRDIEYDVRLGASRYGEVAAVIIPRPGIAPGELGVGKVFIEYVDIKGAMNAQKYIPRLKFMNRPLVAKFYEEYKYKALIF